MADNSTSTLDLKDLGNTIKGGVLAALREHEEHTQLIKFANENSTPGQKGQQSTPDPMKTISDAISNIAKNQEKIDALMENFSNTRNISQQEKGTSSFAKSLNEQSSKELNFSKVSEAIVNEFSTLMRRFGNGPQPGGQSVTNNYQTILNNAGMTPAQQPSVPSVPVPKMDENTVENDQKLLAAEEERQFRNDTRGILKKLEKFLDGYDADGLKTNAPNADGGGLGSMLGAILGALGGGLIGYAVGYLGKFGEMWGNVSKSFRSGFKWLAESSLGKKASELGAKIRGVFGKGITKVKSLGKSITGIFDGGISKAKALKSSLTGSISSGIAKINELKGVFTKTLSGWKSALSDSIAGKGLKKVADTAGKVGGFFKNMASKVGSAVGKVGSMAASGAKSLAKGAVGAVVHSGPVSSAIKAAKSVGGMAMKIGKKVPLVQAGIGIADTVANTVKVAKAGGSVTDIMSTVGAGLIDTLSDTLMIPELMNAAEGAIMAGVQGGGVGDILKGAGKGFIKRRDKNEISVGQGMMANIQNFVGNETETSKRIAKAYNSNQGYDSTGLDVVSGAAGGFGHSAAIYKAKPAAGSMQNTNQATASLGDKLPNNDDVLSEDDKMRILTDAVKEGVKEAQLSPEVREANAQTARETGSAINGQLFGG